MFFQPTSPSSKDLNSCSVAASVLMPHLQNLFQQTSFQQVKQYPGFVCHKHLILEIYFLIGNSLFLQDLIMNLLNSLQPAEVLDGE